MRLPLTVATLLAGFAALPAAANPFPDADLANGRKIHFDSNACHEEKTGRDAGFIYLRDDRKVKSMFDLKRYVSLCNSELRLGLFPEDERDVAAFVNLQWYKLKE